MKSLAIYLFTFIFNKALHKGYILMNSHSY